METSEEIRARLGRMFARRRYDGAKAYTKAGKLKFKSEYESLSKEFELTREREKLIKGDGLF